MASPVIPPLPDGFVLDNPSAIGTAPNIPPLPDGFVLDSDLYKPIHFQPPESTTAGGPKNQFVGNPFATAGDVVSDVPKAFGKGLGAIGEAAKASVADIASNVGGSQFGGNLLAYAQGQPMPVDQAIQDASDESKLRGEFPTASVLANVSQGLTKTAPKIAALSVAPEGLLTQSIAAGGIFGLQDDGSFSPKEAVIGALMPGVGKAARLGVAAALTKGIEAGATSLENPLAQKLIETMGEQAALNAYQAAVASPDLIAAYRQDPNTAYAKIAEMVGSNLAFGLLGVPHLTDSSVPSATQDFILKHSEKYADLADKMVTQSLVGKEGQQAIAQAAPNRILRAGRPYPTGNAEDEDLVNSILRRPPGRVTQANDVSTPNGGNDSQPNPVAPVPAVEAAETVTPDQVTLEQATSNQAEPTPIAAQRATGFTFDGTWEAPGITPRWQFTMRGLPPTDPRFGATFYTAVDAPLEAITARAKAVEDEFVSKSQGGNEPRLSVDNPTARGNMAGDETVTPNQEGIQQEANGGKYTGEAAPNPLENNQAEGIPNKGGVSEVPQSPANGFGVKRGNGVVPRRSMGQGGGNGNGGVNQEGVSDYDKNLVLSLAVALNNRPYSRGDIPKIQAVAPGGDLLQHSPGVEIARSLAAQAGKRIVYFEQTSGELIRGINGAAYAALDPNVVFINAALAAHAPEIYVGHELTHLMRYDAPDLYEGLATFADEHIKNRSAVEASLGSMYPSHVIPEEVVAHMVQDLLEKPDVLSRVLGKTPTLWGRLVEFLKRFISPLYRAALKITGNKESSISRTRASIDDLEAATKAISAAFQEYKSRYERNDLLVGRGPNEPFFALDLTPNSRTAKRTLNQPGVSPEGRDFLERLHQVQSGDIAPDLRERIVTRAFTDPTTVAEAQAKRLIKKTADLITVHDVPRDFASLTDPKQKTAAAVIVVERHLAIQGEQAKIERAQDDAKGQVEAAVKDMENYSSKTLGSDMLSAMANQLPKDYSAYLDNLQRTASPNDNLRATALLLKQKASRQAGGFLVSPGAIERALQEIADNRSIKTGGEVEPSGTGSDVYHPSPSNDEFLNRIRFAGLKGVNAEAQLLLLGGADGQGLDGVAPLLSRIKDLPAKIDAIRKVNDGASQAMREITDFQKGFNPQGKALGVSTAMKRYASLILKSRTADTILKTLDANYAKARERLLGASEAHGLVNELLDAPGYKLAVRDASRVIALQFANALSPVDGEFRTRGPYPELKHDYIITRTPTKEAAAQNQVEAQGLLSDIEKFLDDPNADPAQKQSWQTVHDFVKAQWLENIFSPIEYPDMRDPFDWQHWSVILNPTRTQQSLIRDAIGGRETFDLRRSMDALDYIRGKLQTLELDPTKGVASITLRIVDGAKSHNIDIKSNPLNAEQYRAEILNPVADSLQHFGAIPLKAGDYIPGTATQVTAEDMKALEALSEFEQSTRKIIERDAQDVFKSGTRIMDTYGGVAFSRLSSPTGPLMLTRYWNDDVGNWIRENWRVGMQGNQREAQISKLVEAMWNDRDMFGKVVRGYVFETNPDFSKLSSFANEFRQLANDAKRKPVVIDSLDSLVDAIQPMRADIPREDLAKALKSDLEREAIRIMDNVAGEVATDLNPKGNTAIDRAVASSLKTGGAFLDPRGKMLAPQTFYAIAKVAKSDVMTNPAMAVTIGRVRVLQGMKEVLAAYAKHQGALEEEMRSAEKISGNPNTRGEKIAAYDQASKLGDNRYTWAMLNRRIGQLRQQVKFAEETLTKFSELFTPGISRTATTLNRGLTMQLLSSPGAVVQNLLGASYVQDLVLSGLFKGAGSLATSPLGVTKEFARVGMDRTLRLMQRTNPALAGSIAKLVPFKDELADWLAENTDMVKMLTESGQLPPADVMNRIAAKRAVGFGGEVLRPGTEPPLHLQAAQWAFSTPVGLLHEMMFPRAFDNFANTVMGHRATSLLLRVFSHTQDVIDSRLAGGGKLDSTNPNMAISPKELGMGIEQMKNFRTLLEPIGTLEQLMFDYGTRLKAAETAGTAKWEVPIMDDQKMGAALLAFGKLGNVLSETNTPVVYRMNRVYRILGTFGSWPVNFMGQVMKLVPTKMTSANDGTKLMRLALAAVAVAGVSIGIQEVRRQLMEDYTGKLSGQPGLANVAAGDLTGPEAAKYLLGAMAGGIPYIGTMLGQNTDTQSMFDASRIVPLLGLFKDTASMATDAIKTGDVSKGLMDWSNRYLPFYSAAINRLPGASDYIESKNVGRALRAATPNSIEMRSMSGGGAVNATPLNRYLRTAETAAFGGNMAAAKSSLNQAIQFKMQQKGITREQAMNELRQSIGARQPEQRVYGRSLAPTERQQVLSRMTGSQLRTYHNGIQASASLLSMLPHQSVAKKKSLFKPFAGFKKPATRKFRAFASV